MSDGSWNPLPEESLKDPSTVAEPQGSIAPPRPPLDRAVHAITERVAATIVDWGWITPNGISFFSAAVGGLLAGWLILQHQYLLAVGAIALSGIFDCLDGDLARAREMASGEGEILDSVLDRYVDFFLVAAMILVSPNEYVIPGLLALLGTTLVPYIRARVEAAGKKTVSSIGSRSTRTILIIIGLLTGQILPLLIVLAVISNIAAVHRFAFALSKPNSEDVD